MRQYQAIWEQIKKHKTAALIAPAESHKRIIQAVMKERSMDISFRNFLKKNGISMRLEKHIDKDKCKIEFRLIRKNKFSIHDL